MTSATLEAMRLWTLAVPAVSALVRDFQDRDDILQETATAVLTSFARFDHSQSFQAWAIGIARNQVRLYLRKRGRQPLAFDSAAVDALAAAFAEPSPLDRRLDALGGCVAKLDDDARELCRLRYERDLKPAAIGELLGRGANAVANALQRIRDELRACIEWQAEAGEAS